MTHLPDSHRSSPKTPISFIGSMETVAGQRIAAGQGEFIDLDARVEVGRPLPIMASRMGHLWGALVGLRPPFSKERRLEPQITDGLLTDAAGFR